MTKTRNGSVLLGTTRKTMNIKQDLAERHLKNGVVEYYMEVEGDSEVFEPLLRKFIRPMYMGYSMTNADIMLVLEPVDHLLTNGKKFHIGILFIGGNGSWEAIPDDLEFHHGSYNLYTVVHYPEGTSH